MANERDKGKARLLSRRELEEQHSDTILELLNHGILFKDLQRKLEEKHIFAGAKAVRKVRENLKVFRHISREHKDRMIGIRRKWNNQGVDVEIIYKGKKYSMAKHKRDSEYKGAKIHLDEQDLDALAAYAGATPKEIAYYNPFNPDQDLLALDGCQWRTADRDEAIGYILTYLQTQIPQAASLEQTKMAAILPQPAALFSAIDAEPNDSMLRTATHAKENVRTVWDSVTLDHDDTDILRNGHQNILRENALRIYSRHYGNAPFDPQRMSDLSDQLLDLELLDEADEVATLGVHLAEALYENTDVQTLLARVKLSDVLTQQGKFIEAYQTGKSAADGLKLEYGELNKDVLKAECQLINNLFEQGELKAAESICRVALKRIFPHYSTTDEVVLSLQLQLVKICNELEYYQEAKHILDFVVPATENKFGHSAEKTLRVYIQLVRTLNGLGDRNAIAKAAEVEHHIMQAECNGIPRKMWTLELVFSVGLLLYELEDYAAAEKVFRNRFEYICDVSQFSSNTKVVVAHCWVANTLYYQNMMKEASEIYKKSLVILREELGPHHRQTLICMSNLVWALQEELTFAEFERQMLLVKDLRAQHFPRNDRDLLDSMMWCASLKALRGEWDDSLAVFEETVELQKRSHSTNGHPEAIDRLLWHAHVLELKGDYEKAEVLLRQALKISGYLFGENHPRTLELLNPLARSLIALCRYPDARTLLTLGVLKLSGVLGNQHHRVMKMKLLYSEVLELHDEWEQSETCLTEILQAFEKAHGPNHPYVIQVVLRLAGNCRKQDRMFESQQYLEIALKSSQITFGPAHRRVWYVELELAQHFRLKRNLIKALTLGGRAMTQISASLGSIEKHQRERLEHLDALPSVEHLAYVHAELGDFTQSIALFKRAWTFRSLLQGPNHPSTINALSNLAWAYLESDELYAAQQLYREVLEKRSEIFGNQVLQNMSDWRNFCEVLRRIESYSECKSIYFELLGHVFNRYGECHPYVAHIYRDIGYLHGAEGNLTEAAVFLKMAIRIYQKLNDGSLVNAMIALRRCYTELREYSNVEMVTRQIDWHLEVTAGENNAQWIRSQMFLAESLLSNKEYNEADILLANLPRAIEDNEGQDSKRLIEIEKLQARSLKAQGRMGEAEAFLEECVRRRQRKDIRDPEMNKLKRLLGDIKEELGKPQEKESILQDLLEDLERSSCLDAVYAEKTLLELGETRMLLGKYHDAEVDMKKLVRLQKQRRGENHGQTLEAERLLAKCLVDSDRIEERLKLQIHVYNRLQNITEQDTKARIATMGDIAETALLCGDFEHATPIREVVVALGISTNCMDQDFIWDLQHLSNAYYDEGRFMDQEKVLQKVYSLLIEHFPENYIDISWTLQGLGLSKRKQGKLHDAEQLLEQALNMVRSDSKEDGQSFYNKVDLLATIKFELGKWKEAKDLRTEAINFVQCFPALQDKSLDIDYQKLEAINLLLQQE